MRFIGIAFRFLVIIIKVNPIIMMGNLILEPTLKSGSFT